MSAGEHEPIDSLCPHGPEHYEPPQLELSVDPDWSGGYGEACLYNPRELEATVGMTEWITASIESFVEVRQ